MDDIGDGVFVNGSNCGWLLDCMHKMLCNQVLPVTI